LKESDSAIWLAAYSPIFTSPEPVLIGAGGAHVIWASRRFVVTHAICDRATLIHEPSSAPGLDHVGICLVLNGSMELQVSGAHNLVEPGDIGLVDLRERVRLILGVEGTTSKLTLWIPRSRLPTQLSSRSALHYAVAKANTPGIAVATAAVRALLTQLDAITLDQMDELVAGVVALVGHAMGLGSASRVPQPAPLDSFVTLCRYVEDHLAARNLGVAELAATFGLSRASLYRLFEPVGGVASFIRERRLARAYRELTMPGLQDRRIGPIAYQAGFHSIAAFNRAFLATYGETPRNVRKQKIRPTRLVNRSPDEIGVLARWLLDTTAS
jgi:AraC-like DNA-binding protein